MADHELKIWPDYFRWVDDGHKSFEVRRYDRNFQPGQTLLLREWDPGSKEYTGRQVERKISFMMTGGKHGIESGFCVLQLREVATVKALEELRKDITTNDEGEQECCCGDEVFYSDEGSCHFCCMRSKLDAAIAKAKGGVMPRRVTKRCERCGETYWHWTGIEGLSSTICPDCQKEASDN